MMNIEDLLDKRPTTVEQYLDLVDQALFEIDELHRSAEYDEESLGESLLFVADLEKSVRTLRTSMEDGSYRHVNEDLPFMSLVESQDLEALPFKYLLRIINTTHRNGLRKDGYSARQI